MKLRDIVFLSKKLLKLDHLSFFKSEDIDDSTSNKKKFTHYRLVIVNDVTLKETFSAIITRKKIYMFLSLFFVMNMFLWIIVFSYTPFKSILPETLNYQEKRKLISLKKKVDSLEHLHQINEKMIARYKSYFVIDTSTHKPTQ